MTKATSEAGTWIGVKRVGSKYFVQAKTWVGGKVVDQAYSRPYPDRATASAAADRVATLFAQDLRADPRISHMQHVIIPDHGDEPSN